MYDALSPSRTTLPPLEIVQAIVHACLPDAVAAAEWIDACQAIAYRDFTSANPLPVGERAAPRIVASR